MGGERNEDNAPVGEHLKDTAVPYQRHNITGTSVCAAVSPLRPNKSKIQLSQHGCNHQTSLHTHGSFCHFWGGMFRFCSDNLKRDGKMRSNPLWPGSVALAVGIRGDSCCSECFAR